MAVITPRGPNPKAGRELRVRLPRPKGFVSSVKETNLGELCAGSLMSDQGFSVGRDCMTPDPEAATSMPSNGYWKNK